MCSLFCFKDQTSFFEFTPLYGLYLMILIERAVTLSLNDVAKHIIEWLPNLENNSFSFWVNIDFYLS